MTHHPDSSPRLLSGQRHILRERRGVALLPTPLSAVRTKNDAAACARSSTVVVDFAQPVRVCAASEEGKIKRAAAQSRIITARVMGGKG